MVNALYGLAAVLLLLGVLGFWLYRRGREAERGKVAEKIAEIKDAQLKVDRPHRDAVLGRMRDGTF